MRIHSICVPVALLALLTAAPGFCQGGGPEDLGLGDLGGMGGLGALGGLGGMLGPALGGMMGGGGASAAAAPTVIVMQPTLLAVGDSIYLAHNGKLMRFDAKTLKKLAEVTYADPVSTATAGAGGVVRGTSQGPKMLEDNPSIPKPGLLPGAKPAPGP